ncbi:MAG TPA: Holliday junction resolvase RuvX [Clostridiales bacterium]|nr:Holliday junction resolvase RuvX [Clostridiales bacterium]HQP68823.1 Holliday junction resolvase RuvX [Clostridiales bacterium]
MSRILAIDYGDVRIGLALTDPLKIISSGYKTIKNEGDEKIIDALKAIILSEEVEKIILGHPVGLDGNKTKKTVQVEQFGEKLKLLGKEIILFDESFSSKRAHQIIHEMGKKTGNNKEMIDMLAAQVILEDYLRSVQ